MQQCSTRKIPGLVTTMLQCYDVHLQKQLNHFTGLTSGQQDEPIPASPKNRIIHYQNGFHSLYNPIHLPHLYTDFSNLYYVNPLKSSDAKWLYFKAFNTILV